MVGLGGGGVAVSQGRCVRIHVWLGLHGEKAVCGSWQEGQRWAFLQEYVCQSLEGRNPT